MLAASEMDCQELPCTRAQRVTHFKRCLRSKTGCRALPLHANVLAASEMDCQELPCTHGRSARHISVTLQSILSSLGRQSCRRARRKLQGRSPWRAGRTVNVLPDIPSRARGACIFSHVLQLHVSRTCCVAASEMRCQELPYSLSRKSAWLLGFKAEAHTAVVSSQRYGQMTMSLYGRRTSVS